MYFCVFPSTWEKSHALDVCTYSTGVTIYVITMSCNCYFCFLCCLWHLALFDAKFMVRNGGLNGWGWCCGESRLLCINSPLQKGRQKSCRGGYPPSLKLKRRQLQNPQLPSISLPSLLLPGSNNKSQLELGIVCLCFCNTWMTLEFPPLKIIPGRFKIQNRLAS